MINFIKNIFQKHVNEMTVKKVFYKYNRLSTFKIVSHNFNPSMRLRDFVTVNLEISCGFKVFSEIICKEKFKCTVKDYLFLRFVDDFYRTDNLGLKLKQTKTCIAYYFDFLKKFSNGTCYLTEITSTPNQKPHYNRYRTRKTFLTMMYSPNR